MNDIIKWLGVALSDEEGKPSSQRLFAFIATVVLSAISIILTIGLIDSPDKINVANVLITAIGWLASLGGVTYIGSKMAARNQKPKVDNVQPVEPTKPV